MTSEESPFDSFTASKDVDGQASLMSRVFRIESSKDSGAVVQECKRKYSSDYNVPYNSLTGHTLFRDGTEVWVSITPNVWEQE